MLNLIVKAPVAERANLAHSQIGKRDFGSIKRMIALGKMLYAEKTVWAENPTANIGILSLAVLQIFARSCRA
jgi:hypothetical protein